MASGFGTGEVALGLLLLGALAWTNPARSDQNDEGFKTYIAQHLDREIAKAAPNDMVRFGCNAFGPVCREMLMANLKYGKSSYVLATFYRVWNANNVPIFNCVGGFNTWACFEAKNR